jgi:hypothetical protein
LNSQQPRPMDRVFDRVDPLYSLQVRESTNLATRNA